MLKRDYEKAKDAIEQLKESAEETCREEIESAENKLDAAKETVEEETVKTAGKIAQKIFCMAFKLFSMLPGGKDTAWAITAMFVNMGRIAEGEVKANWVGIVSLLATFAIGFIAGRI